MEKLAQILQYEFRKLALGGDPLSIRPELAMNSELAREMRRSPVGELTPGYIGATLGSGGLTGGLIGAIVGANSPAKSIPGRGALFGGGAGLLLATVAILGKIKRRQRRETLGLEP